MPEGSSFSTEDTRKIARLARLALSDAEIEDARRKLSDVVAYMERLRAVDVSNTLPMTHVGDADQRLASDEVGATLANETLMRLAPSADPPFIRVPKVLEEGGGA